MSIPNRIKTYLYWFLVMQVCLISLSIAVSSLLLGLVILSLIALFFVEKKWILPKTPIDYAVAGYIIIEFVTAFNSDHPMDALGNSKRLLLILILYAVILSFDSQEKIRRAIMMVSGFVAVLSATEIIFYYIDQSERLYLFQHYMTTGGLKMIVLLMLTPFILSSETVRNDRLFYSAAFVPTIVALILTNTRSAWLGLVFGILVMGVLYYRALFGILATAIVVFFSTAPEQQITRAKSILDFSNSTNVGRLNMWSTGLTMWKDKPILGFGDIDLYETYLTYRTPTGDEPAGHLHNIYVHLLVTIGIAGLLAVVYLFFKILAGEASLFKRWKTDPMIRNISLGSLAVFSGFLVNGMFEWNFGDHEIMVFVWFTVGLCFSANNLERTISA